MGGVDFAAGKKWRDARENPKVAFLVDETEERMFSDPFFLGMLRSAQESVAEAARKFND